MSWLTTLHQALQIGVMVGGQIAPAIPGTAGGVLQTVLAGVNTAEALIPHDQPAVKKQVVTQITTAAHPGIDPAAIDITIDQVVALLNQLQAAKSAAK